MSNHHGHNQGQGHTPGHDAPQPQGQGHLHTPAGGTASMTYGFVKCRVLGGIKCVGKKTRPQRPDSEIQYHVHANLKVAGSTGTWDTAVNVGTNDSDDLLQYRLGSDFHHAALIGQLKALPAGFHGMTGKHFLPALDFLRSDVLAETGDWKPSDVMMGFPHEQPAANLQLLLQKAADEHADVYIFGRTYTGGDLGIHDVHMNQGSGKGHLHADHDGNDVWQDGGVLIDFGDANWTSYFTAFTQQTVPTDDAVGDPLPGSHPVGDGDVGGSPAA